MQLPCNISGGDINQVVAAIQSHILALNLPKGYSVTFGGNYARQQELNQRMLSTVIISLLVVFILLLAAFCSVWQAGLILLTTPLALGMGAGAEIQQPMAIVLIGGSMVSTPVVLIILPVLYAQIFRLFRKPENNPLTPVS